MKFTRLKLHGFKSFSDPTELFLEPGLSGVVGPNGCGKSNLVEALRWVMGESSYKAMRASGMDDVIFSGSGNRPARNTAEVTLVLDNSDRTAPAPLNTADVLEVTRRIEREAGLGLSRQRQGSARPRRATAVRRCLDRRAFAGPGAAGPDRRADRGQAAAAPRPARRSRRHFRAALAPARGRTAAAGRRAEPRAGRRHHRAGRAAARDAEAAGAARDPLPGAIGRYPPGRGDALPHPLGRGALRRKGRRGRAGQADPRPRRCAASRTRGAKDRVPRRPGAAAAARQGSGGRRGAAAADHPCRTARR